MTRRCGCGPTAALSACLWAAGCVCLAGCLELVRRPAPEEGPAAAWPPRSVSAVATGDSLELRAGPAARPARAASAPQASVPAAPVLRPERDAGRRRDRESVNEYAYWCIRQELWNEARQHLERALLQDSAAASLHNNLGVVYERLGDSTRAAAAYHRAQQLSPGNRAYRQNLELLGRRQQADAGEPAPARHDAAVDQALLPEAEADSAGARPPTRE